MTTADAKEPPQVAGLRAAGHVFLPITPATAFEEAVERLTNAILLGVLPPGAQLPPERDLAAQLGVARATLRRALATLQETGRIHTRPGRGGGTFVSEWRDNQRPPLPADWRAVLDFRASLEMGATMLATARAGDGDLRELEALHADMEQAEDPDAFRRLDVRFHLKIAEITGSAPLIEAVAKAQAQLTKLLQLIDRPKEALRVSNEQHAGILAAMQAKDAGRASLSAFYHGESTRHILDALRLP
jgi:GntR family transcriptional repressor for pyruvate dehydrogenase complex